MFGGMYYTGLEFLNPGRLVLFGIGLLLVYMAIKKEWEPYELLPLGVGIMLANFPLTYMMSTTGQLGILYILYHYGIIWIVLPTLIFVGLGAMTDFGPLIADPKLMILGVAAQIGIYTSFLGAIALGFTPAEAASIGIIGGADGPTTIFITTRLAPHILGVTAVAAYTYIGMVPFIQPPISRLLTTKEERKIRMKQMRKVSKTEKMLFPILTAVVVILLVPQAGTIVGLFMFGNLLRESGVVPRLAKAASNELTNLVTMFLAFAVGASLTADVLSVKVVLVFLLGLAAVAVGSAGGVLVAKLMNLFLKDKINPLIGAAGVSAVPAAARVAQREALNADPHNHILMYAMAPNVAGVIGSATAAGAFLGMLGGF